MRILLLEKELIVKKDLEMRLRRIGCEVSSDRFAGTYDCIIVGHLSYLQRLGEDLKKNPSDTRLILFTADTARIPIPGFCGTAVVIPRPDPGEKLLNYIHNTYLSRI